MVITFTAHPGHLLLWVGHAKLPKGMPASSVYENLALGLETDAKYFVIVRASCTLATDHGQSFVSDLFVGHSLLDGAGPLIESVNEHYFGKGRNALAACIKEILNDFREYCDKRGLDYKHMPLD